MDQEQNDRGTDAKRTAAHRGCAGLGQTRPNVSGVASSIDGPKVCSQSYVYDEGKAIAPTFLAPAGHSGATLQAFIARLREYEPGLADLVWIAITPFNGTLPSMVRCDGCHLFFRVCDFTCGWMHWGLNDEFFLPSSSDAQGKKERDRRWVARACRAPACRRRVLDPRTATAIPMRYGVRLLPAPSGAGEEARVVVPTLRHTGASPGHF